MLFPFQEVRTVQARQLPAFVHAHNAAGHGIITVRIDGKWREVFDVWADGDDPADMFGPDEELTREITKWIDWASPCWVVVRHVVEEKSNNGEIEDALARFRTCDLVEVQVPVLAEIPASQKQSEPSAPRRRRWWWGKA